MSSLSNTMQTVAVFSNNPAVRGIERVVLAALVFFLLFPNGSGTTYPCACEEEGSANEGSFVAAPALLSTEQNVDDVELDVVDDSVDDGSGDLPEL